MINTPNKSGAPQLKPKTKQRLEENISPKRNNN